MDWLNYHHLLYFWTVVREGSVTAACRRLGLAQPTVSAQIKTLERSLGQPLFSKSGRNIVLTDFGRMVGEYAEQIFTTGQELMESVRLGRLDRPMHFTVGVADVVPKLAAWAALEPVLAMEPEIHLVVREGKPDHLLAELAIYGLDLVISDRPVARSARVKAFNHVLGGSAVAFFASGRLARRYRNGFPGSLDGAPILLPTENTSLRPALDRWLEERELKPRVIAEFEDSALLKVFAQGGHGVFAAPVTLATKLAENYRVRQIGVADGLREELFAISLERRVTHPAVARICEESRRLLKG